MNEKRVTENSVTLFRIWCRLQDSNQPPDDYKAPEESREIKALDNNSFYKDLARAGLKRIACRAPVLVVERRASRQGESRLLTVRTPACGEDDPIVVRAGVLARIDNDEKIFTNPTDFLNGTDNSSDECMFGSSLSNYGENHYATNHEEMRFGGSAVVGCRRRLCWHHFNSENDDATASTHFFDWRRFYSGRIFRPERFGFSGLTVDRKQKTD
ncbi:TPA: hypothetical protein ACT5CU_001137 [Burkholderia cenocepacia]